VNLYDDAVRVLTLWPNPVDPLKRPRAGPRALARSRKLIRLGPAVLRRDHLAGHITASAIIVHDDRKQVLLCLHGRFNKWVQLGGHCENEDKTVAEAALREATEESGIEDLIIDPVPIALDIHKVSCSAGPTHHYDILFAVLAPPGAAEQVSAESHALGWFRPDALPSPMGNGTEAVIGLALARFAL